MAKVVSIGMDGQRVNIHEIAREELALDEKKWRQDIEETARAMLEGNKIIGTQSEIPESSVRSVNFSFSSEASSRIYEKQREHNVGCMCGVNISIDPNEVFGLKTNDYGVAASQNASEVSRRSNNSYLISGVSGKSGYK